jgi:pilus assembly protein Flp/PilA
MLTSVREQAQGLVEYAFLILLIALVVIAVLLILGPIIGNVFSKLNNKLPTY